MGIGHTEEGADLFPAESILKVNVQQTLGRDGSLHHSNTGTCQLKLLKVCYFDVDILFLMVSVHCDLVVRIPRVLTVRERPKDNPVEGDEAVEYGVEVLEKGEGEAIQSF